MRRDTIMIQGTSSDAGKSMLVAALCRCLYQKGISVAPFKPQNMALNSAVTDEGGEIGRAQAVQAQAAGVGAHVDMNPVLLKPNSDTGAQVIIHGKAISNMHAVAYHDYKKTAMEAVLSSHTRLSEKYDCIVVEGAGSPAEINLRDNDIANMGFAEAVDCPVILIADIDRGGVFAQIIGTLELLKPSEQKRVIGFVINKFRGDVKLLESGIDWLEKKTNKPVFGVLPYLSNLNIAAEDAINSNQLVDIDQSKITIAVLVFSRISNHTDFDVLRVMPQVNLVFVAPHTQIPPCDLIILPGSKSVRADLAFMRDMKWDIGIKKHLRYGGRVLGICGGFQMLGKDIFDPQGIEGNPGESKGLGLLNVSTVLSGDKQLTVNAGVLYLCSEYLANTHNAFSPITGYQIHVGKSVVNENRCFAVLENDIKDGAVSQDNAVAGTYLHGIFDKKEPLQQILAWAGAKTDVDEDYETIQEKEIDRIAQMCSKKLDWMKLSKFIGELRHDT